MMTSGESDLIPVGAASIRDGIVAGSHSHKGKFSPPTGWRRDLLAVL
jgi:hypothetical protein